jgi:3-phenylpropionate/trans-cinnamate dioxygenase ferredoxin reductase subunit
MDLYFRQLLSGLDFAATDPLAQQMVNFAYAVGDRSTGEALLIDPAYDVDTLLDLLAADGMTCVGALGTHYHADHVGGSLGSAPVEGVAALLERIQVPVHVQKAELEWVVRGTGVEAGHFVGHDSGDVVSVGDVAVRLIHTPGHTPGSQCFLVEGCLVAGDTLFLQGCGRTDLPGSDPAQMYESLTTRLAQVPDDAVLFPGHLYSPKPSLAMGSVRRDNVVFRAHSLEEWLQYFGGASLAGLRAVQGLRDGGFGGRIVLVGDEPHVPYDRPPLSKQVLAGTWGPERTTLADDAKLAELGVEARLGIPAASLDAEARRVTLADGSVVEADAVVVATGARPRRLPGADEGVLVLRTLEDCARLTAVVAEGVRVVVVGAGFIGSEVASTCAGLGCSVTVLEALPTPLAPALGEQIGAAVGALHARHGVTLITGAQVSAIGPSEVTLADGSAVPADVVVVGIGVVPNVEWLDGSGLEVGNGVVCDEALFAADGVVAAGDIARWPWKGSPVRIEHWEVASQMGTAAARSLLAGRGNAPAFDPVPYFWSDQYGLRLQMLGRPDPGDEVAIVHGSLDDKFVALYGRQGKLTAALAVSRPRQLMAFRPLLVAGASFVDALALAGTF